MNSLFNQPVIIDRFETRPFIITSFTTVSLAGILQVRITRSLVEIILQLKTDLKENGRNISEVKEELDEYIFLD